MQDDTQLSSTPTDPNPNPSSPLLTEVHGPKILQPSPELAQEMHALEQQKQQAQTTTPPAHTGPANQPDISKIYPDMTRQATDVPPIATQGEVKPVNNKRVAERVPSVQVYAFLILIFSAYSIITTLQSLQALRRLSSYGLGTSLSFLAFGISAINVVICTYLLLAKNIKTVEALLTALLIVNGIAFIRSIIVTVQLIKYVGVNAIVSLLISGGLLLYLWSVKTNVSLAAVDS